MQHAPARSLDRSLLVDRPLDLGFLRVLGSGVGLLGLSLRRSSIGRFVLVFASCVAFSLLPEHTSRVNLFQRWPS